MATFRALTFALAAVALLVCTSALPASLTNVTVTHPVTQTMYKQGPYSAIAGYDIFGNDVAQTTYSGDSQAAKDESCASQCRATQSCEFWVRATDTQDCWLKRDRSGYTPSDNRRGATVLSPAATHNEMTGDDVAHLIGDGSDTFCASQCQSNPRCDFWVRATDSQDCWLKTVLSGFYSGNRRGAIAVPCKAAHQEIMGTDVAQVTYTGYWEEQKDASCCGQCRQNPECEFWVRATDSQACWLKKGFSGFVNSGNRRGGLIRP